MGFLDRRRPDSPDDADATEATEPTEQEAAPMSDPGYDRTSLEGVPEHGRERMAELKHGLFTSDLSVDEYLLVEAAGFEPLGFVMVVLSQAMYAARELAMTRMEEEADQLGADGVVGVRLKIGRYDWGENMAEFIALGTAVKHSGGEVHRAPDGRPFTSDLSGQDFYKLVTAGHRPVGLVMGSCVYHVAHQSMRQAFKQIGQNVEMPNFTQALYDARELAMERMQHEAGKLQAKGVVAVRLEENSHGWGSHVIEFFAVGTAITSAAGAGSGIEKPTLTLPVDG
jgi:uncharacterized protein YbjQ (UPF0145 family)